MLPKVLVALAERVRSLRPLFNYACPQFRGDRGKELMSQFILNTSARTQTGRSASRRLRKANRIPAVIYGKHTSPESVVVEVPEFKRLLKAMAGRAVLVELNRDGQKSLSFLEEIQRDPITDQYLHIDFQEVNAKEEIEVDVPLRVTGESFGVKNQNGVIDITTHSLRIRCLPKDLPAVVTVDISALQVGEMIKVSELTVLEGVEFLDNSGQPVVICTQPVEEVVEAVAETEVPVAGAKPDAAASTAAPEGGKK